MIESTKSLAVSVSPRSNSSSIISEEPSTRKGIFGLFLISNAAFSSNAIFCDFTSHAFAQAANALALDQAVG